MSAACFSCELAFSSDMAKAATCARVVASFICMSIQSDSHDSGRARTPCTPSAASRGDPPTAPSDTPAHARVAPLSLTIWEARKVAEDSDEGRVSRAQ